MTDRCPVCGNQGIDGWHLARCAYQQQTVERVELHAADLGVDLVMARDLLAHMRELSADMEVAMKRTMTVMDLGWRPVLTGQG